MRAIPLIFVALLMLLIGVSAAGMGPERSAGPSSVPDAGEPSVPEAVVESPGEEIASSRAVTIPEPAAMPEGAGSDSPESNGGSEPRVDRDDDDRRRRSRWSRRNRYPEPTFTPEEWLPPEGPVRIALQAGHWRADEAPEELNGLKTGGTHAAGMAEWEVNLALARRTGAMLEELGYQVDILPAVVPPDYHAHLFIAIHADGADDTRARGFRIAAPSRDYTGRSQQMVDLLEDTYGRETGLRQLPDVTRRMRNYYAFNVRRYEHSLDPRTIALILETGFLTSPADRMVIVDDPDRVARGIVEAIRAFPVTALTTDRASADPARETR